MNKLTEYAKQLGSRGGKSTAKKYSKEQRKKWGALGGRPKKVKNMAINKVNSYPQHDLQ